MNNQSNLELRDPRVSEVFGLFLAPHLRTDVRMKALAPAEIKRVVGSVDGRGCDIDCARGIHADRARFAAYVAARNSLLDGRVESGAIFAQCPHCRGWEADLTPLALAIGLRAPFWPVSDDGFFLAVPSLATLTPRGSRPPSQKLASRVRAVARAQPGSAEGDRALLFRNDEENEREQRYWREYAHDGVDAPLGREQWSEDIAGFRAALRLAAVADDARTGAPLTVPEVMDFTLGQLMFFDNAHYLLHDCAVPEDHGLTVRCGACSGNYLPLL